MEALSAWQLAGLVVLLGCLLSLGQQTGEVRLVDGKTVHEGRVEIWYDNTWGTVCDDDFGENNKGCTVVCRQLGYSGKATTTKFGYGRGAIWLDGVSCQGGENHLMDCRHQPWGEHDCSHREDAACSCDFEVRLAGGGSFNEGRVQVLYNNSWGNICDDLFDDNNYACPLVCEQLGYRGTHVYEEFGRSTGRYWLDDVRCKEGDRRLVECRHREWGEHDCGQGDMDAGCSCHVDLRLVGDGSPYRGRVEVRYETSWQTLSWDDYGTDDTVCRQVCHHLEHSEVNAVATQFEDNDMAMPLKMICLGQEGQLQQCVKDPENDLHHAKGCSCQPVTEGEVRLVGGRSICEGRIEVAHNDTWGTVCTDGVGANVCTVACRQLGYSERPSDKTFGIGTGKIRLYNVYCRGNESRLVDCSRRLPGESICRYYQDAGCVCGFPIRLVAGSDFHEGRVEVFYNNVWGTVCDDGVPRTEPAVKSVANWDSTRLVGGNTVNEGRLVVYYNKTWGTVCGDKFDLNNKGCDLVCRSLGYTGESEVKKFGPGSGPIWLDDTTCDGSEKRLVECSHRPWGTHVCIHSEDVGCSCDFKLRLVGGSGPSEGRVEVLYTDTWGTVCDDGFGSDNKGCAVVCQQLGYSGAAVFKWFGHGAGPIWLDGIRCQGNESRLANCKHRPWGYTDCQHREDAGCSCDANLRLVGGAAEHEGRLELSYKNTWRTVCGDEYGPTNNNVCTVVCRQLGYSGSSAFKKFEPGTGTIWLANVVCKGDEHHLLGCAHTYQDADDGCRHALVIGCSCDRNVRLVGDSGPGEGSVEVPYNDTWGTLDAPPTNETASTSTGKTFVVPLATGCVMFCVVVVIALTFFTVLNRKRRLRGRSSNSENADNRQSTMNGPGLEMQAVSNVSASEQQYTERGNQHETHPETTGRQLAETVTALV